MWSARSRRISRRTRAAARISRRAVERRAACDRDGARGPRSERKDECRDRDERRDPQGHERHHGTARGAGWRAFVRRLAGRRRRSRSPRSSATASGSGPRVAFPGGIFGGSTSATTRRLATLGALPTRRDVYSDRSDDPLAAAYLTTEPGGALPLGRQGPGARPTSPWLVALSNQGGSHGDPPWGVYVSSTATDEWEHDPEPSAARLHSPRSRRGRCSRRHVALPRARRRGRSGSLPRHARRSCCLEGSARQSRSPGGSTLELGVGDIGAIASEGRRDDLAGRPRRFIRDLRSSGDPTTTPPRPGHVGCPDHRTRAGVA